MLHHPEVSAQALALLRNPASFQWYLIPILAFAVYLYANEAAQKNWKPIAAGLALYSVHWFYEIANALIGHFSGHALWTVPTGTAFLLLVGVGAELSLMFAVAGLILSKFLPADPAKKIFGVPNRVFFAIVNAAGFAAFEIFLARTPAFAWVYPWWGAVPVFITVYIPFFLAAFLVHDAKPATQKRFIGGVFVLDAVLLVIFAGVLRWI
jgi:hypothetical protein